MSRKQIILSTLNARYIHASLGLRYLYANLGELQDRSKILEFTINQPENLIVEEILHHDPMIVGFGVYIWNIKQTEGVVRKLKKIRPGIVIIIGGPEVSYEFEDQVLYQLADHLITGQADIMFRHLCASVLTGNETTPKLIRAAAFKLDDLQLPYRHYSKNDIANRVIYVEASRGCPFKCEFCLSSLDKTAYPFDTDLFLTEMDALHRSGARTFKFVDRTFNLKIANSIKILEFFIQRMSHDLFLHFELIPDNLPEPLKALLGYFPAGQLQFEIGIQTFTSDVQALISRRQNNEKAKQNIRWLKENSKAHLHTDLIFGLPGETLESFASSFNQLVELGPDEIQLGILKRLRGTPISRHAHTHLLKFNSHAPYEIKSTGLINQNEVEQMHRFSKFWDKIANSGRFMHCLPLILAEDPFSNFLALSRHLFGRFGRTHSIHVVNLMDAIAAHYPANRALHVALAQDRKQFQSNASNSRRAAHNQRQLKHLKSPAGSEIC